MPDLTLDLELRDVDGPHVIDPDVVVRLARSDGSANAWRVSLEGQRTTLNLRDAPAGSVLQLRVTPSRYRDIATNVQVTGNRIAPVNNIPLVTPRRPSEWLPIFTTWDGLPPLFDGLKERLAESATFRLGRDSKADLLTGDTYDAVDPRDESCALAKMAMLNIWSRLANETPPGSTETWSQRIRELFFATRERIVARIDQECFDIVTRLVDTHAADFHGSPIGDHIGNLKLVPSVDPGSFRDGVSAKTREQLANLQFTAVRATVGGVPTFLLDCDIDENGNLLLHTFDLIKHVFTKGTHPIDVHEALRQKFPAVPTGYALEPRVVDPQVTTRIVAATALAAPPAPTVVSSPLALTSPIGRVAVLGDSVPWGQGLLDAQKMHNLLARAIGVTGPVVKLVAHSGATIGVGAGSPRPPAHGEVPKAHPTILHQCRAFPSSEAAAVDLVIVNGGINDVDVRFIVNPFTDPVDLADTTNRACGPDMITLLHEVANRFPKARILVLEYYPILSPQSRFQSGFEFLSAIGAPFHVGAMAGVSSPVPSFWTRVVDNCGIFYRESTAAIRTAVATVRPQLPGRDVVAVDPGFKDDNAALAPDAWLFGINWDLSPEDAVAAQRHVQCDLFEPDLLRREQCYRASAGHPNPVGAQKYAEAIVKALVALPV